jgi:hypothetical protein
MVLNARFYPQVRMSRSQDLSERRMGTVDNGVQRRVGFFTGRPRFKTNFRSFCE